MDRVQPGSGLHGAGTLDLGSRDTTERPEGVRIDDRWKSGSKKLDEAVADPVTSVSISAASAGELNAPKIANAGRRKARRTYVAAPSDSFLGMRIGNFKIWRGCYHQHLWRRRRGTEASR